MTRDPQASDSAVEGEQASAAGSGSLISSPPPTDRIAVVVNGNAKNVTSEVISHLDQILLGGDLFVSRKLEDAREIAKTLVNRGYGTVLTGGGDGTFMVMVTEVVREARLQSQPLPRFGFLKLGTGNALAHVVGSSGGKQGALEADIARLREDAGSRPLHLVEVDGVLAPFCGFGADAVVLRDYAALGRRLKDTPFERLARGPSGYLLSAVTRTVPRYVFSKPPHCRIINQGEHAFAIGQHGQVQEASLGRGHVLYDGPAQIVGVSTIAYYGFGFRAFPYAEERLDCMHLRVSTMRASAFLRHVRGLWRGEYENSRLFSDFLVQAVRIEMNPATPFQIGGDIQGERERADVRITAKPIRLVDFYSPPSAR